MDQDYENVPETEEITFAGIGRLIKRSALRVGVYLIIGLLAASLIALPIKMFVKTSPAAVAQLEYVYRGIESGLDPSGATFDKNQIRNTTVVASAITAAGLGNKLTEVTAVRDSIVIADVLSKEYQDLRDRAASGDEEAQKQLNEMTYVPTKYEISIGNLGTLGLDRKESVRLLDSILDAYRDWFAEVYSDKAAFSTELFNFDVNTIEFLMYYSRYEASLNAVDAYVQSFENVDTSFRSEQSKKSFTDLRSIYKVLKNSLDEYFSFVSINAVARNLTYVRSEIEQTSIRLDKELESSTTQINSLHTQIEKYVPNYEIHMVDGKSVMVAIYGEDYKKMQNALTAAIAEQKDLMNEKSKYEQLKILFAEDASEPQVADEEAVAEATARAAKLKDDGFAYVSAVNQTVEDYYRTRFTSEAIRLTQAPVYTRNSMNVPLLYIYAAVVVLAIAIGMIVTYIKGKALTFKRSAAPAESAAETKPQDESEQ